jgi:multiple sugar transport system ATP-binding protein
MANVRFEQVSKRFDDISAVADLNLEIQDGEFLALVGPSGCGKSTTLRLLAGLESPTGGRLVIGDRVVNDVPAKDRDIAMVFQSYALYPHMTVFENMAFGLRLRRVSKAEIHQRVEDAAKILGIDDLLNRKPRQLSGGQRQRVALGRAIVRDPAVFLLDEPLSNLDAKLRIQTRTEIKKLHQRLGGTFLYVTHDQVEAMTMATRIAVLNSGVLQQVGSPQELYDAPRNMFVAGFIGSPSMNFFDATVHTDHQGMFLESPGFRVPVSQQHARALLPHASERVILGIRPEDVHDNDFRPPEIELCPVVARVDVTELLGNETLVHMLLGDGTPFLGRFDPRSTAQAGKSLTVAFDTSKMHVFDPESGQDVLRFAESTL